MKNLTVNNNNFILYLCGGICGLVGTVSYIITITVPMHPTLTYLMAMSWPLLSIIFAYSLYQYVATYSQSTFNQLSFIMACIGFGMLAMMMSIQLAVGIGMENYISSSSISNPELLHFMQKSLRLIDLGIDVSWDLFIGVSLIFLSIAINKNNLFKIWWTIIGSILGIGLIVLNVATFPWPPNTKGLIDIGPLVGLYIIFLSTRLIIIGVKRKGISN